MNDSISSSTPASPRVTLKLKGAARKSGEDNKAPPIPQPQGKPNGKPGAHWSDEYKSRMQTHMAKPTGKCRHHPHPSGNRPNTISPVPLHPTLRTTLPA